jgi:hypothetical protein
MIERQKREQEALFKETSQLPVPDAADSESTVSAKPIAKTRKGIIRSVKNKTNIVGRKIESEEEETPSATEEEVSEKSARETPARGGRGRGTGRRGRPKGSKNKPKKGKKKSKGQKEEETEEESVEPIDVDTRGIGPSVTGSKYLFFF